jgi:hypothetical protein
MSWASESSNAMKRSNPYSLAATVRLPQFRGAVSVFQEAMSYRLYQMSKQDGILRSVNSHIIHEGRGTTVIRKDTEREETEMAEASAEIKFSWEEIENFTVEKALTAIQAMAKQFNEYQSKTMFKTIDRVTKETGNVVHGNGPMTNEMMIETLGRMDHDFRDGKSSGISIVVAPSMMKHIEKLQQEFEQSPDLQKQYNDMMAQKRDEYRRREMDRTLDG